ncbi:MAG: hypothetical protein AAF961_05490, partial [Planctomycetota bacterium]
ESDADVANSHVPESAALVYEVISRDPVWSLSVSRRPTEFAVRPSVEVRCGVEGAEVKFEAQVDNVVGEIGMHRVDVPIGFRAQRASLQTADALHPLYLDWTQSSRGRLWLRLPQSIDGDHTLRIDGSMPYTNRRLAAPRFELIDGARSEGVLSIFRASDVLATWTDRDSAPTAAAGLPDGGDDAFVPVGRYALSSPLEKAAGLSIKRNPAEAAVESATVFELGDSTGAVALHVVGEVRRGLVDQFQISAPAGWTDATVDEGKILAIASHETIDPNRSFYRVLLPRVVGPGERFHAIVRGTVNRDARRQLNVPDLRIDGAKSRRYLALPASAESNGVWQLRGVQFATPPAWLESELPTRQNNSIFRVKPSGFSATHRRLPSKLRMPAVKLALFSTQLDENGNSATYGEYFLLPGGAKDCEIRTSDGSQLVSVEVADQQLPAKRIGNGLWQAPLSPSFLPQRITIQFKSTDRGRSNDLRIIPPAVFVADKPLPILRAMWRIESESDIGPTSSWPADRLSADQFFVQAVRHQLEIVNDARPLYGRITPRELEAWMRGWRNRIQTARNDLPPRGEIADAARQEADEILLQLDDAQPQPTWQRMREAPPSAWQTRKQASFWQSNNFRGSLHCSLLNSQKGSLPAILAATALVVGAAIWKWRQVPQLAADFAWRWPQGAAMALGAFWWATLEPSAIGLAIALIAAISLVRRRLVLRGTRRAASRNEPFLLQVKQT